MGLKYEPSSEPRAPAPASDGALRFPRNIAAANEDGDVPDVPRVTTTSDGQRLTLSASVLGGSVFEMGDGLEFSIPAKFIEDGWVEVDATGVTKFKGKPGGELRWIFNPTGGRSDKAMLDYRECLDVGDFAQVFFFFFSTLDAGP